MSLVNNIKCRNLRTKVEAFLGFSKIIGLKKVTSKVYTNNKNDLFRQVVFLFGEIKVGWI